jgi:hypothetical protein
MSFPQGKVIDAQHQHSPPGRIRRGADEPQQGGPAHCTGQPAGKPGPSAATQGQRDRLQHPVQAAGPPAIPDGQARHLLRERGLHARVVAAEEPAGLQVNEYFLAAARGIGQLPLIAAVRPARGNKMLDGQVGQVRNQDAESFKIARPA